MEEKGDNARIARTETEFVAPQWNQIYAMLLSQAGKIRQSCFKADVIVGITRGGLIPARVLSDLLEITALASVAVEFYLGVGESRNEPVLSQQVSADVAGKKALLVDDIADTGRSLRLAREHLLEQGVLEVQTATLYHKPFSIVKPDFCERETRRWVVFPWETRETIMKIVEKNQDASVVAIETAKLVEAGLPKRLVDVFLREVFGEREC